MNNNQNNFSNEKSKTIDNVIHHLEGFANTVNEKSKIVQDKIEQGSKYWVEYIKSHPIKASLVTGVIFYLLGRIKK